MVEFVIADYRVATIERSSEHTNITECIEHLGRHKRVPTLSCSHSFVIIGKA